jgi:hypothetical protein
MSRRTESGGQKRTSKSNLHHRYKHYIFFFADSGSDLTASLLRAEMEEFIKSDWMNHDLQPRYYSYFKSAPRPFSTTEIRGRHLPYWVRHKRCVILGMVLMPQPRRTVTLPTRLHTLRMELIHCCAIATPKR